MSGWNLGQWASAISVVAGMAGTALAGPPFAEEAAGGKTLEAPRSEARQGVMYYALTDRDRQVYFTSEAPLETIKGQSNQVIGYVVAGEGSSEADLKAGEWHLPVESMKTGIPLRDEHLAGSDWLDAASHPDIVLELDAFRGATRSRSGDGFRTYTGTLVGEFTIHGVTNEVEIEGATVTFLDESQATKGIAPGDLMAIRAKYSVKLSDYAVSHPTVGNKVADEVEIDTTLYMTTAPPERW